MDALLNLNNMKVPRRPTTKRSSRLVAIAIRHAILKKCLPRFMWATTSCDFFYSIMKWILKSTLFNIYYVNMPALYTFSLSLISI